MTKKQVKMHLTKFKKYLKNKNVQEAINKGLKFLGKDSVFLFRSVDYINMKRLKERLEDLSNTKKVDLTNLKDIISPNIVKVDDCFILDLEIELTDNPTINWNRILKMYGDKTGYEASCNELRINDYLDCSDLFDEEILLYAFQVMAGWEHHLKEKFPDHKFVVILSIDEGFATIRFYKYREEESSWLKADIEEYGNEAILVKEIN